MGYSKGDSVTYLLLHLGLESLKNWRGLVLSGACQGNEEYCIVVGWDAEAAAMRFRGFRGRGQASRVPWLYGTVPYCWAEHTNSVAL